MNNHMQYAVILWLFQMKECDIIQFLTIEAGRNFGSDCISSWSLLILYFLTHD